MGWLIVLQAFLMKLLRSLALTVRPKPALGRHRNSTYHPHHLRKRHTTGVRHIAITVQYCPSRPTIPPRYHTSSASCSLSRPFKHVDCRGFSGTARLAPTSNRNHTCAPETSSVFVLLPRTRGRPHLAHQTPLPKLTTPPLLRSTPSGSSA